MPFAVEPDGFSTVSRVLGTAEQQALRDVLGAVSGAGRRGALAVPAVAALARSPRLLDLVRPHVAREPSPARAIFFDKSPGANWLVPWHQDLTLALRSRVEVPGFGPWSVKDGVPHVQPPVELLEQMLTVRLHLDDADETNGALRVLPDSHRLGRLSPGQIQELRARQPDALCAASAGDALLMRPLLLHASGRSTSRRHRRVLHIEYAGFALPAELDYHEGIPGASAPPRQPGDSDRDDPADRAAQPRGAAILAVGRIVFPLRGKQIRLAVVAPRTAADHPVGLPGRNRVEAPLPDIAAHVIETVHVRPEAADR